MLYTIHIPDWRSAVFPVSDPADKLSRKLVLFKAFSPFSFSWLQETKLSFVSFFLFLSSRFMTFLCFRCSPCRVFFPLLFLIYGNAWIFPLSHQSSIHTFLSFPPLYHILIFYFRFGLTRFLILNHFRKAVGDRSRTSVGCRHPLTLLLTTAFGRSWKLIVFVVKPDLTLSRTVHLSISCSSRMKFSKSGGNSWTWRSI